MVKTNFFEKLNFTHGDDNNNSINPDEIAKIILNIFQMENNTVMEEINISPLKKVIKFL